MLSCCQDSIPAVAVLLYGWGSEAAESVLCNVRMGCASFSGHAAVPSFWAQSHCALQLVKLSGGLLAGRPCANIEGWCIGTSLAGRDRGCCMVLCIFGSVACHGGHRMCAAFTHV